MKTITKVYQVYTIDELSEDAQEKARQKYIEGNEYMFMEDCMNEYCHEYLQEAGIIDSDITVMYSLSCCQGDGAMFTGECVYTYKDKKYYITIKHSGNYYHHNSKSFYIHDEDGEDVNEWEEVETSFDVVYKNICRKLETRGYDFIEYEDSMENFKGACEANEYTFTIDGVMDNS